MLSPEMVALLPVPLATYGNYHPFSLRCGAFRDRADLANAMVQTTNSRAPHGLLVDVARSTEHRVRLSRRPILSPFLNRPWYLG